MALEKEWTPRNEQKLRRLFERYASQIIADLTDEEKASMSEFRRFVETRKSRRRL